MVRDLIEQQRAAGRQQGPGVPDRFFQIACGVQDVGGHDNVEAMRRKALFPGALFDVQQAIPHEGIGLEGRPGAAKEKV